MPTHPIGAARGWALWWDPRRSLGARLFWMLVPSFLLSALVYRGVTDRQLDASERQLTALLVDDEIHSSRLELRQAVERRSHQLDERAAEVIRAVRESVRLTEAALVEPLPAGAPQVEKLIDEPPAVYRTEGIGTSAALASRAAGLNAAVLHDLRATRRLETGFGAVISGHSQVSAAYVATMNGVVRAVPWRDLARYASSLRGDFRMPDRWPKQREDKTPEVRWTSPYEDVYANRGRIVTAYTAVYATDGPILAEVGLDWAFADLFERVPDERRRGESELLFDKEGHLIFGRSAGRPTTDAGSVVPAAELGFVEVAGKGPHPVFSLLPADEAVVERTVRKEPALVAAGRLAANGWTYARVRSVKAIEEDVKAQLAPLLYAQRDQRRRHETFYFLLLVLFGLAIVAVARRSVAPVTVIARSADAIVGGSEMPDLAGLERRDEVGRLARAIQNLARRIRRRMATMEGMHDLSQTASVMTRPEETYARLTRRIAELLGATKSWLVIFDPVTRELVFTPPGYGVSDEALRGVRLPLTEHAMAVQAFRTGEAVVSNEISGDPRTSPSVAAALDIRQNAIFVPLKTEVGPLGVLVACDKPGGFDKEDEDAVQAYADQAALLLRNARLYEELQNSYERLREAQRNRDHFIQNVNHELRTPLTAIIAWSEVLAEDKPGPKTVETAVGQIRRSAQFLLTMISDLLDLSRVQEGAMRVEPVPTDVGGLVRDAIEPISAMAQSKGIEIRVEAPTAAAPARLDPLRMRQVIWNLVHNAVKFTPKGGHIDVRAACSNGEAIFVVSDDGAGVDPKDLPFIFDRFRQGDGGTTRAYRGTGIGLALAKSLVELHGGTIGVESPPGEGATFTVKIPAG